MSERRADYNRRRRHEDVELRQRQMRRTESRAPYAEEEQITIHPGYPYAKQKPAHNHTAHHNHSHKQTQQHKKAGKRMQKRKAEQKRRRRNSILLVAGLILLLIGTYAAAKVWVTMDKWQGKAEKSDFQVSAQRQTEIVPEEPEKEIINVALLGTDEDGFRADVNMLVSFNTETKDLHLISVPRDTRVVMTQEMIDHLEERDAFIPYRNGVYGQCKLTELHAYAGEGNRCAFSVAMMEEVLDIEVDYYIKFDLTAFKQIVDAVGGVDFYVPMDMYWDMTDTGGPLINLREGMQHLDGDKAEQVVRFRNGYAQKDLKRIQVQQDFMKALIEKICSSDTLKNKLDDLVQVVLDCTETDVTIKEALKYIKYVKDLDPAKITNDTIPGVGGSYFDRDEEGTKELIDWRIHGIEPVTTEETTDDMAETE